MLHGTSRSPTLISQHLFSCNFDNKYVLLDWKKALVTPDTNTVDLQLDTTVTALVQTITPVFYIIKSAGGGGIWRYTY